MDNNISHIPVLAREVITYLQLEKGMIIVDCTIGVGGHAIPAGVVIVGFSKECHPVHQLAGQYDPGATEIEILFLCGILRV